MRVWAIAILSLAIQGVFAVLGFLVGLACVGLYLGYTRAWAICSPVSLPKPLEDEDE